MARRGRPRGTGKPEFTEAEIEEKKAEAQEYNNRVIREKVKTEERILPFALRRFYFGRG